VKFLTVVWLWILFTADLSFVWTANRYEWYPCV